jgi:hypothetical protein
MKIVLEITDDLTGLDHVLNVSMHDAQKLYRALREIVGDAQYQAQPGQLITVPDARINTT